MKYISKLFRAIFSFQLLFCFIFVFCEPKHLDALVVQNEKLIEKISRDYTNKFCNSIAFGLSKESAMNFAYKENNLIFKNRKGIDQINKDLIANKIAINVVEDCGYIIGLKGEEGINSFENNYKSMNTLILEND